MPTYVYECEECGQFEVTQRITSPPLDKCIRLIGDPETPEEQHTCDRPVKRVITATNFSLKGSGWAKDGYR